MRQPTDLLTAAEVAALLRCSPATVYRYAEDGTLPSIRVGGIVRFPKAQVHALLAPNPDAA